MVLKLIILVIAVIVIVKRASIVALFGKSKYANGDYEGSLKVFAVADKIGNLSVSEKILYGYNCLRCGKLELAKKVFSDAYMLTKPASADRYRVTSLNALVDWKSGDIDAAIEKLEDIYESGFKNTNIYQNLGIMYNLKGEYEKALKFNTEAFEYNADDNILTDNLADTYALMGNYEKAKEIYDDLLSREPEPNFPEAYYGCGRVLIALGDKEKGIELIRKSLTKPFSFLSLRSKEEVEQMLAEYGG